MKLRSIFNRDNIMNETKEFVDCICDDLMITYNAFNRYGQLRFIMTTYNEFYFEILLVNLDDDKIIYRRLISRENIKVAESCVENLFYSNKNIIKIQENTDNFYNLKLYGKDVFIDNLLKDAIRILALKGYETEYSCQGHIYDDIVYENKLQPSGYIKFKSPIKTCPKCWYTDDEIFIRVKPIKIPFISDDRKIDSSKILSKLYEKYQEIYIKELNKWVEDLPDLVYQKIINQSDEDFNNHIIGLGGSI